MTTNGTTLLRFMRRILPDTSGHLILAFVFGGSFGGGAAAWNPVAFCVGLEFEAEEVFAGQARDNADRCYCEKEKEGQKDVGNDEAEDERKRHPNEINRFENSGHGSAERNQSDTRHEEPGRVSFAAEQP